jgi:hypothetical protein
MTVMINRPIKNATSEVLDQPRHEQAGPDQARHRFRVSESPSRTDSVIIIGLSKGERGR